MCPQDERRTEWLKVRVTPSELSRLDKMRGTEERSDYVRDRLFGSGNSETRKWDGDVRVVTAPDEDLPRHEKRITIESTELGIEDYRKGKEPLWKDAKKKTLI
jgi:hypothetical protein